MNRYKYPIVILPGWLLGSKRFEPLAHIFEKHGYVCQIVSFPGFEQGFELPRVYRLTDYVKYVDKFIKQHQITKAIFIGHSFGGRVALKLLSQEPNKGVVLIMSGTPGFPPVSRIRKLGIQITAKIGNLLTFIPPFIFFRKKLRFIFFRATGSMDYYHASGYLKETFKHVVNETLVDYMKKIRLPSFLLWGQNDNLVPVRIARRMSHVLYPTKLEIVKYQGHNFIYKDPELFAQHVLNFLTENDL